MNIFEGEDLNYPLPFRVDGNLVPPDEGTAVCSIYDHEGMLLDTSNPTGSHHIIAGSLNTITPPREFEKRTVILSFTYFGQPHRVRTAYRITPMVQYGATPDDVRDYIGVAEDELPDRAIDLFRAYTYLKSRIGVQVLNPALISGNTAEMLANEAMVLAATLDAIPSLMQRVKQMEADGLYQFRRQTVKSFDDLRNQTQARLDELLAELDPNGARLDNTPVMTVVSGTDIITGE